MEAKFTRGPWTMNDFGEIYGPDGRQILVSGVALPCGDHSKAQEARANGQLFFAAPGMLAALETVEWLKSPAFDIGMCPYCGADEEFGHADSCLIGIALRAARGEK